MWFSMILPKRWVKVKVLGGYLEESREDKNATSFYANRTESRCIEGRDS